MVNFEQPAIQFACQPHSFCALLNHKKIIWNQRFSFKWLEQTSLDHFQRFFLICLILKDVMKALSREETFHSHIMMKILGQYLFQKMKRR